MTISPFWGTESKKVVDDNKDKTWDPIRLQPKMDPTGPGPIVVEVGGSHRGYMISVAAAKVGGEWVNPAAEGPKDEYHGFSGKFHVKHKAPYTRYWQVWSSSGVAKTTKRTMTDAEFAAQLRKVFDLAPEG